MYKIHYPNSIKTILALEFIISSICCTGFATHIGTIFLQQRVQKKSTLSSQIPFRHSQEGPRIPLHFQSTTLSNLQDRLIESRAKGVSISSSNDIDSEISNPKQDISSRSGNRKIGENVQDELGAPSYAAPTLDGRLLCAAQCAYEISPPYFRPCSYRANTMVKRVSRGVNSALIGCTADGVTIAFRGTVTSSLLDWLQNAALFLSDIDEEKYKMKGKFHTGFYRSTKSLFKPLKSILKNMLMDCERNGWKKDIYLTGHSKGGAMASIAAILLKREKDLPDPQYVCTFASAKVGDSQFRDAYNQRFNQTSYEAYLDIIPFLPPSTSTLDAMSDDMSEMIEGVLWSETSSSKKDAHIWDYQTVGTRKYINENGIIIENITSELDTSRIHEIERECILSLDAFKQAHSSGCISEGCNGSYFWGIADSVCNVICIEDN